MELSEEILRKVEKLITENKLRQAFEVLENQTLSQASKIKLINLKRRFSDLNSQIDQGTIRQTEISIEKNKITQSLLSLINQDQSSFSPPTYFSNWNQMLILIFSIFVLGVGLFSIFKKKSEQHFSTTSNREVLPEAPLETNSDSLQHPNGSSENSKTSPPKREQQFELISKWSDCNRKLVLLDGKYGYVDSTSDMVIKNIYDKGTDFENCRAIVFFEGRYHLIDEQGEILVDLPYDDISELREGMARVVKDGKAGFINKEGTLVVKPQFQGAWLYNEGHSRVKKHGQYTFIDKEGNFVSDKKYDEASNFLQGRALVCRNNKFGYIDHNGKEIIPLQYKFGFDFNYGFGLVYNEKGFYFLDHIGRLSLSNHLYGPFKKASRFNNGIAKAELNDGKVIYLDARGIIIYPEKEISLTLMDKRYMESFID